MKILRYLMVAVLVLGISNAAHAFSWVLNDPTYPEWGVPITDIQPGSPVSFTFVPCDVVLDHVTYTGCAQLYNDSHQTITTLTFTFTNTLDNASIDCSSDAFAPTVCGLTSDDSGYLLSFTATCSASGQHDDDDHDDYYNNNCDNTCGLPPGDYVYIYENSGDPQFPTVHAVANAPEPSSIYLALSGIGSLGYFVRRRRRSGNDRTN